MDNNIMGSMVVVSSTSPGESTKLISKNQNLPVNNSQKKTDRQFSFAGIFFVILLCILSSGGTYAVMQLSANKTVREITGLASVPTQLPIPSVTSIPTEIIIPSIIPKITINQSQELNKYLSIQNEFIRGYKNENYGFYIQYPESIILYEQDLAWKGGPLKNSNIYLEFSAQSIQNCKDNCDQIKNINSVTFSKQPVNLILGAKKNNNGDLSGQYLTYEFKENDSSWAYLTLKFDDNQPSVEEMAIFQRMASSFDFIPKKTSVKNPTVMQLPRAGKPVIYLYPEREQQIYIKLNYSGKLLTTYPDYDYSIGGWKVIAYPDGKLINISDYQEYSYIFWDGETHLNIYDINKGFVIEGAKTKNFLQSTLKKIGLIPKEYNEFIVYWLPKLEKNKYNLIYFAGKEYTDTAKLEIYPKPDSILRVFMAYKPLDKKIDIPLQKFETFERKGFTVVEWGGREIDY